ncbi:MAG: YdeI/OmpD-associated family protein [Ignavibacteria bacterium]|nr:YdeI/OmpD-associated family protein [Ignavibacteria bacterium]
MNPKVDFYFAKAKQWQDELMKLRTIILGCGLTEELKWGVPTYTLDGKNVLLIHTFKTYCAILFFKGAILPDRSRVLVEQTKNVQASRHLRFTSLEQIIEMTPIIQATIQEAIDVEKAGLKVELKKTKDFTVPIEFQTKLDDFPALRTAFEALTPGRQRAYLLYFNAAKQSKTRTDRVEKWTPHILNGKGLDD